MKEVVTYRFVLSAFIQVFTCMCIPFHTLQSNIYLFFIYFVCVAHGEGWGILFFWGGGGDLEEDALFYYCATMHFELADFAFPDKITEMCYFSFGFMFVVIQF